MKRSIFVALGAAILTAAAFAIPSSATVTETSTTYYRGWSIQGLEPYFQLWNPGPGELCVESMTVTSGATIGAVFLLMAKPLPNDIQDAGASWPEGIDLAGIPSDDPLPRSRGQLRASESSLQLGAQLHNIVLQANTPYTLAVDDCLGPERGLAIRYVNQPGVPIVVRVGARWSE